MPVPSMPTIPTLGRRKGGVSASAGPLPATALAHDTQTQTVEFAAAGDVTTTHTPVGIPKGVVVAIIQNVTLTEQITGVTYGGVAMTRIRKQDRHGSSAECGCVYLYFLGSSIPTGPQSVVITVSGALQSQAVISTVVAVGDTAVDANTGANSTSLANPSLALTFTGTLPTAEIYYAMGNGFPTVFTTVEAGSTHQASDDFGAAVAVWARKHVEGVSSTTIGYTATADDVVHAALVVKDA